ncbi:MAG: DUF551 domain-containing protein [Flavobacteriaceae bacterium]|nr:DUF551 domain-containing protein [Flavobacteriaceae bacterium]
MSWISVKDRLPEQTSDVLVCYPLIDGYIGMASACYDEGKWWDYKGDNVISIYQITHWMELPEPPKQD